MQTEAARDWRVRWRLFFSELIGTAMLVFGGLSVVIAMFGDGSPLARTLPNEAVRMAVTAFLFGTIGSAIALSPIGKESGAHINPAVTLGFWTRAPPAATSSRSCLAPLRALFRCSRGISIGSVAFGATLPGKDCSTAVVVMGEAVTTFGLIATLCRFLGFRELRRYTPFVIPFLYAVMVPLEAHISGTSTNPARSFGPALISGRWDGWWIYWVGPILGTLAAILVCGSMARRIEVAKLYYFENDRRRLFHRMAGAC